MRIALGIEYNGQDLYGWQSQKGLPTVQFFLEEALSKIADQPTSVFCAGRTDAGVHAVGQVVHFDTTAERNLRAWTAGVNSYLPSFISVGWAQVVDENFHARFSAIARRYHYIIYNHPLKSALWANRATWFYPSLNAENMHIAAQYLLGEQDFTSFRSSQCESNTPMRNVHEIHVRRQEDFVIITIQANAFLHHMVRNIVGSLLKIGVGEHPPEWVDEILKAKDRRLAGKTAPAMGLYLSNVIYPDPYLFPKQKALIFE